MSGKSTAQAAKRRDDQLDRVFAALANRTRRAILARLEQAPASITELAEPFSMTFPAVSKHLRVLERAGLVLRRVDGRVHRCAFEPSPLQELERWLADHRTFWSETLDALAAHVATRKP